MRSLQSVMRCGLVSLLASGCTGVQRGGTSPVQLMLSSLEAGPGHDEAQFRQSFQSDVLTDGRVVEDGGRVGFTLALKDPGTADQPTRPSSANFVTLNRYRVAFVRADGRATPGEDVPFAFDGAMTVTVGPEGAIASFVVVRAQSKLEPPLIGLRDAGGAIVLSTLADVTFFGRDQAGHEIRVSGTVGVNFADWADDPGE